MIPSRAKLRGSAELLTRFGIPLAIAGLSVVFLVVPALRWGLVVTLPLVLIALVDFFQHSLISIYH